jgi:hypothetical protein
MIYRFYTAGSIPGIAGIFAGVVVDVDETSNEILTISPLAPLDAGAETTTSVNPQVETPQPQPQQQLS